MPPLYPYPSLFVENVCTSGRLVSVSWVHPYQLVFSETYWGECLGFHCFEGPEFGWKELVYVLLWLNSVLREFRRTGRACHRTECAHLAKNWGCVQLTANSRPIIIAKNHVALPPLVFSGVPMSSTVTTLITLIFYSHSVIIISKHKSYPRNQLFPPACAQIPTPTPTTPHSKPTTHPTQPRSQTTHYPCTHTHTHRLTSNP